MNMVKYCPECGMFYYIDNGQANGVPLPYDAYHDGRCGYCGTQIVDSELSIDEYNRMISEMKGNDVLDHLLARKAVGRKVFFKYVLPNMKTRPKVYDDMLEKEQAKYDEKRKYWTITYGMRLHPLIRWIGNMFAEYRNIPSGVKLAGVNCPVCGSHYVMHTHYETEDRVAYVCECQDCYHKFLDLSDMDGRFNDKIDALRVEVEEEWEH